MVGEKVAFEGASDMSYIMTVLKAFGESELGNRTELISLKNKFGIYAVCDGLYRIEFGSSEDMSSKLKGALATINSSGFEAGILSILDVSVPNEVSVISDNTITLVPNE